VDSADDPVLIGLFASSSASTASSCSLKNASDSGESRSRNRVTKARCHFNVEAFRLPFESVVSVACHKSCLAC
jgi:hypothetical protein